LDSTALRSTASAALLEISGHRRLVQCSKHEPTHLAHVHVEQICDPTSMTTGASATPLHLAAYIMWRLNPEHLKQAVATARVGARHDAVNALREGGMS
jgi:hypothetical protein